MPLGEKMIIQGNCLDFLGKFIMSGGGGVKIGELFRVQN
jgi:hypothetical protein